MHTSVSLVRCYIEGLAPPYLHELCCSTTQVHRRCCLRSAAQAELDIPRSRTATRQCRAFSVAGPAIWNGLPVTLCQIPVHHSIPFLSSLKTVMFDRDWERFLVGNLEEALYRTTVMETCVYLRS